MAKKSKAAVAVEAVETVAEASGFPTYETLAALVPANEKRTFTEADHAIVATVCPTVDNFAEKTAQLNAAQLFCACVSIGRAGCALVAKSVEAKITRKSGVQAFKAITGNKSRFFAGSLTYLLLQLRKND